VHHASAETAAGDFQPKKKPRSGLVAGAGFSVLYSLRLYELSQAFASAPHRLLPGRSRSPTGTTRRTGNARRNAGASGLTSILAGVAMGATDKLRANRLIARCDHRSREVVNETWAPGLGTLCRRQANSTPISSTRVTQPEMLLTSDPGDARPLWLLTEADLPRWLSEQPPQVVTWVRANGFQGERHRVLTLPGADGHIEGVLVGLGSLRSTADLKLWHAAGLSDRLPALPYRVAAPLPGHAATHFVLGWLTGAYRMGRYRTAATSATRPALVPPPEADLIYAQSAAAATSFARDLINTPANDL
jgi:hypothetical protein